MYGNATFCFSIFQLMNVWVVSTFGLVWSADMNIHIQVFIWIPVFISLECTHLGGELLVLVNSKLNLLRNCQIVFQSSWAPFSFLILVIEPCPPFFLVIPAKHLLVLLFFLKNQLWVLLIFFFTVLLFSISLIYVLILILSFCLLWV